MTINTADLLTLSQWLSPAFPLGSFAYSHGLETAITAGDVSDATGTAAWVGTIVRWGSGRMDAALLVAAMRGEPLDPLQARARALAASKERWEETWAQGRAFSQTVSATGVEVPPLALPLAVGAAAQSLSLECEVVAAHYLQAFAATLVGAAVRFVPLGQAEGQRTIAGLRPLVLAAAEDAVTQSYDQLGSSAWMADIATMAHEDLEVRIFKT